LWGMFVFKQRETNFMVLGLDYILGGSVVQYKSKGFFFTKPWGSSGKSLNENLL